jgi:hypothetical protein
MHSGTDPVYDCILCGHVFARVHDLHLHIQLHAPDAEYVRTFNMFDGSCSTYEKRYPPMTASLDLTLGRDHDNLVRVLAHEAALKRYAKCSLVVTAEFAKVELGNLTDAIVIHLRASQFTLTIYQNYIVHVEQSHSQIASNLDDFLQRGSGWTLQAVYSTKLEIARCRSLAGACGQLTLTADRRASRGRPGPAMKLDADGDRRCFFKAVARHFVKSDNMDRIEAFIREHLITDGIQVPTPVHQLAKFEQLNQHLSMKVNVIYQEEEHIYPIFASREMQCREHVNILLYKELVNGKAIPHYAHIDSLDKFLRKSYRGGSGGGNSYQKSHICPNCLCKFYSQALLLKHFALCSKNKVQAVHIPEAGERLEFSNFIKRFKIPLVGFYDFESNMKKPDSPCSSCPGMSICHHKTTIESIQVAGTYSILIVDHLGNIVHSNTHSSEDCTAVFVEELLTIEEHLMAMLSTPEPLNLSPAEERRFKRTSECHICGKPFSKNDPKVRDHCHLLGTYV